MRTTTPATARSPARRRIVARPACRCRRSSRSPSGSRATVIASIVSTGPIPRPAIGRSPGSRKNSSESTTARPSRRGSTSTTSSRTTGPTVRTAEAASGHSGAATARAVSPPGRGRRRIATTTATPSTRSTTAAASNRATSAPTGLAPRLSVATPTRAASSAAPHTPATAAERSGMPSTRSALRVEPDDVGRHRVGHRRRTPDDPTGHCRSLDGSLTSAASVDGRRSGVRPRRSGG